MFSIDMSKLKEDAEIIRLAKFLENEGADGFTRMHAHVNPSEELEDHLEGLAVIPYRLFFDIMCLLDGLAAQGVPIKQCLEIGLSRHSKLWEVAVGEAGREACIATFSRFLESKYKPSSPPYEPVDW